MDVRYQQDISAYAAWQAGNRQLNRESLEYNRMREHYQGREDEMPYKTLGSFGKARRSATLSPAFKKWRYRNRDARQYEEWIRILGVENMPTFVNASVKEGFKAFGGNLGLCFSKEAWSVFARPESYAVIFSLIFV